jgi:hypothetical protein
LYIEKGRKLRRLEKKMADTPDDLHIREWNYDQQDPHEAASKRKTKKNTSGLSENLLKQIFPS